MFGIRRVAADEGFDVGIVEDEDGGAVVASAGHGATDGGGDEGGVSDDIVVAVDLDIVAGNLLVKAHGGGKVAGVIDDGAAQPVEVAYQTGEEDGAVLAVAVGVVEALLGEEGAVVAPHIVVTLVLESRLHPVEQAFDALADGARLKGLAQLGIELVGEAAVEGSVGEEGPAGDVVAVNDGDGVRGEKLQQTPIDADRGGDLGIALGGDGARLGHVGLDVGEAVDAEGEVLFMVTEGCGAHTDFRTGAELRFQTHIVLVVECQRIFAIYEVLGGGEDPHLVIGDAESYGIAALGKEIGGDEGGDVLVFGGEELAGLLEELIVGPVAEMALCACSEAVVEEVVEIGGKEPLDDVGHGILRAVGKLEFRGLGTGIAQGVVRIEEHEGQPVRTIERLLRDGFLLEGGERLVGGILAMAVIEEVGHVLHDLAEIHHAGSLDGETGHWSDTGLDGGGLRLDFLPRGHGGGGLESHLFPGQTRELRIAVGALLTERLIVLPHLSPLFLIPFGSLTHLSIGEEDHVADDGGGI